MAPATRGLLSGVIFFLSLSLIISLCMLFPHSYWGQSWFVEKTMLSEDFCWFGEGIWETNVVWGDDHKLHCSSNKPKLFQNAYHEYCSSSSTARWFHNRNAMCYTVKVGRAAQICAMVLTASALAFAGKINSANLVPGMRFGARGSIACLLGSIMLESYLIYLMLVSPLFDEYHALQFGKANQVNYRGLGCVFQSPFMHGPQHLVQSAPLKCVYPGPAVVFALSNVLLQIMAVIALLALLYSFHDVSSNELTVKYSLHGAFMRRLTQYHRFEQYLVALIVPLMALGNGILLVAWFYNGMEFLLVVRVRMWGNLMMEIREQVFSFDPVTTLQDFWSGKGYFMAIVTLLWLDLFPFFKILLWLYFWFIPTNEVLRGRVFSWIDYLGRWSLVTLFSLCIMTLGFLFMRDDLGVGPVNVNLQVIIAKGNGVTWFLVALLWTVLLGNVSMLLHSFAKQWEEHRSAVDNAPMDTPSGSSLFGEIVRRFSLTTSSQRATQEHHEEREAMVYMPVINQGMKKFRFSKAGRRTLAVAIIALFLGILAAASTPLMQYVRLGSVPMYLLRKRKESFSLISMAGMVKSMGGTEEPAYFMQLCFTMFSIVVPLMHCFGLSVLFFVPLTLLAQQRVFRLVEFLDTWNALDVFAMAVFVAWLGFESISRSIVAIVVPGMTEVSRLAVHDEVFIVVPRLHHSGFALLVCIVLLQKSMTHFLMELGAAGITQRQLIAVMHDQEEQQQRAVLLFSPAARYTGMDAGLPGFIWRTLSVAGLLREM